MADNVDGQKKIAVGEAPEIAPHACDLAGGAGEEDASSRTDCIAYAPVRLFPDGALHVFGTHDGIETSFVVDEHMADSPASLIEGRAADDAAIGKHLASKEPENTTGRRPLKQIWRIGLCPRYGLQQVIPVLTQRGTGPLTGAASDANIGIHYRIGKTMSVTLHEDTLLGADGSAGAAATASVTKSRNSRI